MSKILQKLKIQFHKHSSNLLKNGLLHKLCGRNSYLSKNIGHSAFSGHRIKVTVVGAAGKVGQPLCLMLKQSPLIEELCVHDIVPTGGFALELNHVDTNCKVTAFTGKDNLANALQDSNIVVLLASASDTDTMSLEQMWYQNSHIVLEVMNTYAKISPQAFLAVGTSPINSIVPMCAEVMKKTGGYNPNILFGITAIDCVRANTFVAQCQDVEPECAMVPVIGGHSEETMIPVLSQAKPCAEFSNNELEDLTLNIRKAQENIVKLMPHEAAPLSTAFATARFVISLVKGIMGYPDVVECAYVPSKMHPQLKYLATPIQLGPNGIARNVGIPRLSEFESCMFDNAIPSLIADIKRGETFVEVINPPPCDPCSADYAAPKCPKSCRDAQPEA